jgi:hypothetical protein
MSKSASLYLRLPSDLKGQVDVVASASDASLTQVVAGLVEVGLRNTDESVEQLEGRISELEREVRVLRADRDATASELAQVREEMGRSQSLIETVSQRLKLQVGTCRTCGLPVTGEQVFVAGACSENHNLQVGLFAETSSRSFNQQDLVAALAVVGVALGVSFMLAKR